MNNNHRLLLVLVLSTMLVFITMFIYQLDSRYVSTHHCTDGSTISVQQVSLNSDDELYHVIYQDSSTKEYNIQQETALVDAMYVYQLFIEHHHSTHNH